MRYACIDIGSNTTRLLAATVTHGRLTEIAARRDFLSVDTDNAQAVADTVAAHAAQARELEVPASNVRIVATASLREALHGDELATAIAKAAGAAVEVLTPAEEARLAFAGAAHALDGPGGEALAVVDVGGGSTELAIGTADEGVDWWVSFGVGSALLADACLHSDPPASAELDEVRARVQQAFGGLDAPPADRAVAVGGSAASTRRLVGDTLSPAALEAAVAKLAAAPRAQIASAHDLDAERVRVMPAAILLLAGIASIVGMPLGIARGGLREGVILDLVARDAAA